MNKTTIEAMTSTGKDDWETPQELFNELDREFHFTLDPCCTHESAKCAKHYTPAEDGLIQDWGGGDRFLQSSLFPADPDKSRSNRVGAKVRWRGEETRHHRGGPASRPNGHRAVS